MYLLIKNPFEFQRYIWQFPILATNSARNIPSAHFML